MQKGWYKTKVNDIVLKAGFKEGVNKLSFRIKFAHFRDKEQNDFFITISTSIN